MDAEAILEAKGYACRPGPKVKTSPDCAERCIGCPQRAVPAHHPIPGSAGREAAYRRVIEPYGILLGTTALLDCARYGQGCQPAPLPHGSDRDMPRSPTTGSRRTGTSISRPMRPARSGRSTRMRSSRGSCGGSAQRPQPTAQRV